MKGSIRLIMTLGCVITVLFSLPACARDSEHAECNVIHRTPQVPASAIFAGKEIDMTRYDMYERYERELTTACYMHSTTMLTIKRANRYLPVIEPILKQQGIPLDFIYLAAIESAFNPLAVSPAKAAGIWQFMASTAREYGLEVNADIDERYNVEKATVAACKYLRNAYKKYGSWVNAAAAYNAGTNRITDELARQGVDEAFDLHLVQETSRYVFRILATKEVFSSPQKYGFYLTERQLYQPIETRAVEVDTTIVDLVAWAKKQGATYKELKEFNPWLRTRKLPNKSGKKYKILLPLKKDMYYTDDRRYKTHNENWIVEQ